MRIRLEKEGFGFLLGILVILVIAMSYANNLAFIFAFSLSAICLISLAMGYAEIKSVEVLRIDVNTGHAGDTRCAGIWVRNLRRQDFLVTFAEWKQRKGNSPSKVSILPGAATNSLQLEFRTARRGRFELPAARVSTNFPAGIFCFSKDVDLTQYYFVYPRLQGMRPLPNLASGMRGEGEEGLGRGEDFSGHRAHQAGESERHVDWKLAARRGQKMVKEFRGGSQQYYFFRDEDLAGLAFEAKVEQLAKWISEVNAMRASWGFEACGLRIESDSGAAHYRRSMELLSTVEEAA